MEKESIILDVVGYLLDEVPIYDYDNNKAIEGKAKDYMLRFYPDVKKDERKAIIQEAIKEFNEA